MSETIDLDTPSLPGLIYILRNQELWPEKFKWNYAHCGACAMGLAFYSWKGSIPLPLWRNYADIGKHFGLNPNESCKAFLGGLLDDKPWVPKNSCGDPCLDSVTPEMVADVLEKYL